MGTEGVGAELFGMQRKERQDQCKFVEKYCILISWDLSPTLLHMMGSNPLRTVARIMAAVAIPLAFIAGVASAIVFDLDRWFEAGRKPSMPQSVTTPAKKVKSPETQRAVDIANSMEMTEKVRTCTHTSADLPDKVICLSRIMLERQSEITRATDILSSADDIEPSERDALLEGLRKEHDVWNQGIKDAMSYLR